MRRFENRVQDEFWEVWIEHGRLLCHRFGRGAGLDLQLPALVGTERFPTAEAASAELERRIAERRAGGFVETTFSAVPGLPFAPPIEEQPTEEAAAPVALAAAHRALLALRAERGSRSWRVARAARRAKGALRALGPIEPSEIPLIGEAFEGLIAAVTAPGPRRLPLSAVRTLLPALKPAAQRRIGARLVRPPASRPNLADVR